jgi:hypothetical protein
MKQQEVFKKTGEILKELSDQYEDLKSTADHLNDLELELFIANAHFLIDHAEILRKVNLQKVQLQHTLPPHVEEPKPEAKKPAIETISKPFSPEPKYFEPVVQPAKPVLERAAPKPPVPEQPVKLEILPSEYEKPVPQISLGGSTGDSYSFERQEPETIKHELVLNEADDWDEEVEVIPVVTQDKTRKFPEVSIETIPDQEPKPKEEPQADETQQPNIIPTNPEPVIDNMPKTSATEPELVKEEKVLTLNQKMSAQLKSSQNNNGAPAEAPIKDIKSVISLNDKLLFVKDLFNGYSLAYSEAIEIVNRFTSFEEADRFLKTNYVTKNNWEGKKATADKFYALLKRRYA